MEDITEIVFRLVGGYSILFVMVFVQCDNGILVTVSLCEESEAREYSLCWCMILTES